jgi:hypothetical protein
MEPFREDHRKGPEDPDVLAEKLAMGQNRRCGLHVVRARDSSDSPRLLVLLGGMSPATALAWRCSSYCAPLAQSQHSTTAASPFRRTTRKYSCASAQWWNLGDYGCCVPLAAHLAAP